MNFTGTLAFVLIMLLSITGVIISLQENKRDKAMAFCGAFLVAAVIHRPTKG